MKEVLRNKLLARIMKGNKNIIIISIGILSITILSAEIKKKASYFTVSTQSNLKSFDHSLEKIESHFEDKNWELLCKESIKASTLIKVNISGFRKIEPNYNWVEISKILKLIPNTFCKS